MALTKKKLVEFLGDNFEEVDVVLVDELFFNISMVKDAKKDIVDRGQMVNVAKQTNNPYYQVNQSVSIYNNALKNIINISKKLGLSPKDRADLGIELDGEEDTY